MEPNIKEVAERIRGLRFDLGYSAEEMADAGGVTAAEYQNLEKGERDFSFTFLYRVAGKLNVDIVELLTGENPRLSSYTLVRKGKGLPIKRREGFQYYHLSANFKNKLAETFLVIAPYREEEQEKPIHLSEHKGQEFDYVLKGTLKCVLDGHTEILGEGDSVYYDSSKGHGMIAADGDDCVFLAVVLKGLE